MSNATPLAKISDYLFVKESVLLRNIHQGIYLKIMEVTDWGTIKTYNLRKCDGLGELCSISKALMFWVDKIDDLIDSGKIEIISWKPEVKASI